MCDGGFGATSRLQEARIIRSFLGPSTPYGGFILDISNTRETPDFQAFPLSLKQEHSAGVQKFNTADGLRRIHYPGKS